EEKDLARAEAEERAVIERDPRYWGRYSDLARLLAIEHRYQEALAAIDEGTKHGGNGDDMFASLLGGLLPDNDADNAAIGEALAAAQPQRMEKNASANLQLANIRVAAGRPRDALPLLKKAIELDPKNAEPHIQLAVAYRRLGDWRAALAAADDALKLDTTDSPTPFKPASALARLGRLREAMA